MNVRQVRERQTIVNIGGSHTAGVGGCRVGQTWAVRWLAALIMTLVALTVALSAPATSSAQDVMDMTFYGYFAEDLSTAIMLGDVQFDTFGMADLLVSPEYANGFFDSFGMFSQEEIARNLRASEVAKLQGADEYLVYEGMLDFVNGVQPGYVMLLSVDEHVFLIVGYASDRADLFAIAEETIAYGQAPAAVDGYVRVNVDQ